MMRILVIFLVTLVTLATTDTISLIRLVNKGYAGASYGSETYVGVPVMRYNSGFHAYTRVCDDDMFGDNEANFLCRKAGFRKGGKSTTYGDLEEKYRASRTDRSLWESAGTRILTITNCTPNASRLSDCNHQYGGDCTIDDTVALKCIPNWELEKVELKRNVSSTVVSGSYGTVV
uniref:Putative secretory peptide-24 n=1 Tax=Pleurobrachia bachei TaxID=34499 RepID=M4H2I0_PLEBA|nr:putative secretory peptide-24 [Pleurobrachia bachei]|eukprot:sb/3471997/